MSLTYSVIIPNFNYAAYLSEAIESVLQQTYPAQEIIVVDDGSTDDSLQVLNSYRDNPRIKIISQKNGGHISAIDAGLDAASGNIICLLDADDCYTPAYLSEINKVYETKKEIDLVFCRTEPFGEASVQNNFPLQPIWLNPLHDYDYGSTALIAFFADKWWIGNVTSTLSFRVKIARFFHFKELYASIKNSGCADTVVLQSASLNGYRKYFINAKFIRYRVHEKSESNNGRPASSVIVKTRHRYKKQFLAHQIFEFYAKKSCLNDKMYRLLLDEASLIPEPLPEHLRIYQETYKKFYRKMHPRPGLFKQLERTLRKIRKKMFNSRS